MATSKPCEMCNGTGKHPLLDEYNCSRCHGRKIEWTFDVGDRVFINRRWKIYKGRPRTPDHKYGAIASWPELSDASPYVEENMMPVQLDGETWVEWIHRLDLMPEAEVNLDDGSF